MSGGVLALRPPGADVLDQALLDQIELVAVELARGVLDRAEAASLFEQARQEHRLSLLRASYPGANVWRRYHAGRGTWEWLAIVRPPGEARICYAARNADELAWALHGHRQALPARAVRATLRAGR